MFENSNKINKLDCNLKTWPENADSKLTFEHCYVRKTKNNTQRKENLKYCRGKQII